MHRSLTLVPLLALAVIGCADPSMEEVSTSGTNAFAAMENARGTRVESFYFGGDATNEVVDYVFVLDNSTSMTAILKRVQDGFGSLGTDAWPRDARIAVMSTIPHDLENADVPHRSVVKGTANAVFDPGFTQFISADSIAAFKELVPKKAKRFSAVGCDEWFAPDAVGEDGIKCITAHTQIALEPVMAEAGLTAFAQLLERNKGSSTFRDGASVNVVFVSDTHDPGIGARDLIEARPTAEQLVALIERDNRPSSIKFHAIAPETECSEKWAKLGPAYFDAAAATGGQKLDACVAKDYRPVLNAVIADGARPTKPVFGLGADAEAIETVTVDGVMTRWTREGSSVVVEVPPQAGSTAQVIEVTYQKAPVQTEGKKVKSTRRSIKR